MGSITYESLLGNDIADAVNIDSVVLDHDIWKNGREYFLNNQKEFGGVALLPVLDKEHRLLCFAWEDVWANRELRMLDELSDCSDSLDFKEVYPEYDAVTIHGFNELSFYFAEYLIKKGIVVRTEGALWKEIDMLPHRPADEDTFLDYRRLVIYGEGVGSQEERIELRASVSAEFECIDRVYEENIRKGFIRETKGSFKDILDLFRGRQICILGIGDGALNAYDLLLGYGLDICCFIHEAVEEQGRTLFGKKIMTRTKAMTLFHDPVFLEANAKHSLCGTAELDFYHYLGYKRNERFFLLKDYIEVPANGFKNVLSHIMKDGKRLVCVGDPWLCQKLKKGLEEEDKAICNRIVYCDIFEEYTNQWGDSMKSSELSENDFCLVLLPQYYGCKDISEKTSYLELEKRKYREMLKRCCVTDFVIYSIDNKYFRKRDSGNYSFIVGQVVIGSSKAGNGNVFFREVLEKHPNIVMLPESYLNSNLFSICVRLSMEKSTSILSVFWEIYDKEEAGFCYPQKWECSEKEAFNFHMKELLERKEYFSPQELFVFIHYSYARQKGKMTGDLPNMAIYWEPHYVSRKATEDYAEWLYGVPKSGYILNIVRNAVVRAGTVLRFMQQDNRNEGVMPALIRNDDLDEKREYIGWHRITLSFEELKCDSKRALMYFYKKTGIPCSKELIEIQTGFDDVKSSDYVKGFDLTPVYRLNENIFSAFDRFRLSLVHRSWQKSYGYPYVNSLNFSRRELQEIFSKRFRFEEKMAFLNNDEKLRYQRLRNGWMERYLWEVWYEEIMEK